MILGPSILKGIFVRMEQKHFFLSIRPLILAPPLPPEFLSTPLLCEGMRDGRAGRAEMLTSMFGMQPRLEECIHFHGRLFTYITTANRMTTRKK